MVERSRIAKVPATGARSAPATGWSDAWLLHLLNRLDEAKVPYDVKTRASSARVDVRLPGLRWEIKLTLDGVPRSSGSDPWQG